MSIMKSVVSFFMIYSISFSIYAWEVLKEREKFIKIDMEPVCTELGQVRLVYTNVSPLLILSTPHYIDSDLFDPVQSGVTLYSLDKNRIKLKPKRFYPSHGKIEHYAAIKPGQRVEHIINFNRYSESEIDKSKPYDVVFGFEAELITEQGDIFLVTESSVDLNKNHRIEPSCWK